MQFDPYATGQPPHGQQQQPTRSSYPGTGGGRVLDGNQTQYLQGQGFSSGLIRAISCHADEFPMRMWVFDNSASMSTVDCLRYDPISSNFSACSRWDEVKECVDYHATMSVRLGLPTRFTMLNKPGIPGIPQSFAVGERGSFPREIAYEKSLMSSITPMGKKDELTSHVRSIQRVLSPMAASLVRDGKKVAVILATDGLPSDKNGQCSAAVIVKFIDALKSLQNLPVWVVFRLCTEDENVIEFYNTLDLKDFNCDVVSDFYSESLEVYLRNPWLNYSIALHRFREMGLKFEVLDELDETPLSLRSLGVLCELLFTGERLLPDPGRDWTGFVRELEGRMAKEKLQWNPITRKFAPWIDLNRLTINYASSNHERYFAHHPNVNPQPPRADAKHHDNQRPSQTESQSQSHPQSHSQSQFDPMYNNQRPSQTKTQSQPSTSQPQPSSQPPLDETSLKRAILSTWALTPPDYKHLRPIDQLLTSVHMTFPPAFGLPRHDYFKKWKPFSPGSLSSGQDAVLKKAMKKMKFFLHPDKLPNDFNEQQAFMCRMLWDITSDAMEARGKR